MKDQTLIEADKCKLPLPFGWAYSAGNRYLVLFWNKKYKKWQRDGVHHADVASAIDHMERKRVEGTRKHHARYGKGRYSHLCVFDCRVNGWVREPEVFDLG
jgi:hypothetical protein